MFPAGGGFEFPVLFAKIVAIGIIILASLKILILDLRTEKTMKTLFEEYVAVQRMEGGW